MPSKPLIRVIGSLNIDFMTLTARCPGPGETLTAKSLSVNAGGKGANQAVACGRAAFVSENGQDVLVEMIGAVGVNDPYYASLLRPTLEESGVSTKGVTEVEGSQTGTATIIVDEGAGGENRILVVPGANCDGMGDLDEVLDQATYDQDPDVVVMQGEIPRPTVLALLQHFSSPKSKTSVVFNPAPVFPEGIPMSALRGLAVLVVNETEAIQLARSIKEFPEISQTDAEELRGKQLNQLGDQFHQIAGVRTVLITLGSKGVFYSADSGKRGLVAGVRVPKVVDTTAAGDTFVGYIATALARLMASGHAFEEFGIADAVERANAAAAKCVQKTGAMQSIPFGYE